MIHIVIIIYQGLVQEVAAYKNRIDALLYFKQATGVTNEALHERSKVEDAENILGQYAGSDIWNINVV